MTKINLVKSLVLALGGAALVWASVTSRAGDTLPANAAALRANAGNKFALVPTANPYVLGHPVDGVAQVSLLGNCHFHGEGEIHLPTSPGQPIVIVSTSPWALTASDGTNSLRFDVQGTATFDPVNPNFANLSYTATFVGGTGAFASATGNATFEVTAQFESALEGWATWTMKGYVITPPSVP
jgi:hypothetical protein